MIYWAASGQSMLSQPSQLGAHSAESEDINSDISTLLLLLQAVTESVLWLCGEQSCLDLPAALLQAWQMFLQEGCLLFMTPLPAQWQGSWPSGRAGPHMQVLRESPCAASPHPGVQPESRADLARLAATINFHPLRPGAKWL